MKTLFNLFTNYEYIIIWISRWCLLESADRPGRLGDVDDWESAWTPWDGEEAHEDEYVLSELSHYHLQSLESYVATTDSVFANKVRDLRQDYRRPVTDVLCVFHREFEIVQQ